MAWPLALTLPHPDFTVGTAIKHEEILDNERAIKDWVTAALDLATGHDHSGAASKGPQIPTGGIVDGAVTTLKIGDAQVTAAKLGADVTVGRTYLPPYGKGVSSLAYKLVVVADLLGPTTVYTVPAGKRALVTDRTYRNSSAGSINITEWLVPSGGVAGDGNRSQGPEAVGAGASSGYSNMAALLSAGDFVSAQASASPGINWTWAITEFADTEPLVPVFISTLGVGDTTLYTCPAGKTARIMPVYAGLGGCSVMNPTAGSIDLHMKVKPSGGAATTVYVATLGGGARASLSNFAPSLGPGDAVVFAGSAAGLNIRTAFVEV